MTVRTAIGGFLPLELPLAQPDVHVWRHWGVTPENSACFHTARAALAFLLRHLRPRRVWLPAYICRSVADAVRTAEVPLAFYPLSDDYSPDSAALKAQVRAGEAVLAVDYFGRAPGEAFRDFAASHPEIAWIEDRAQAMDTGREAWGDYVLYSPRKLFGVPDGGIVVSRAEALPEPAYASRETADFAAASLMRYEDAEETRNAAWYARFQACEAALDPSPSPMSRLTRAILDATDPRLFMLQRRENYGRLSALLAEITLWPDETPRFTPLGFPLRLDPPRRDALAKQLAEQRIFAPRYWAEMPSPADRFPHEHTLAAGLLCLPCDQRYGAGEMEMMAGIVKKLLGA